MEKEAKLTVKQFAHIRRELKKKLDEKIKEFSSFEKEAAPLFAPLPKKLRPAKPKDIVPGNVIWYHTHGEKNYCIGDGICNSDHHWSIVDDVLACDSGFKAYHDIYGCRYGLENAFVEVEDDK